MNFYATPAEFLVLLGEETDTRKVTLDDLARRVPRTMQAVLPVTSHVPDAVFRDFDFERYHYKTVVKSAIPLAIRATRHYRKESEGLSVVDSEWRIVVDCFRQRRDAPETSEGWEDIPLVGSVQLYVPEDEAPEQVAQLISARLEPENVILLSSSYTE